MAALGGPGPKTGLVLGIGGHGTRYVPAGVKGVSSLGILLSAVPYQMWDGIIIYLERCSLGELRVFEGQLSWDVIPILDRCGQG